MAVTKTQVLGWNLQAFSDIATDADKITGAIDGMADTMHRTIHDLEWSGQANRAATDRADREKQQMRTVGSAYFALAEACRAVYALQVAVTDIQTTVHTLEGSGRFRVDDDWTVHAVAQADENEAGNNTVKLKGLASHIDTEDARLAPMIAAAVQDINALAPISSTLCTPAAYTDLSDDTAKDDLRDFEDGTATPEQIARLELATQLSPEELAALQRGDQVNLPKGQFEYLQALMRGQDGMNLQQIEGLGSRMPGADGAKVQAAMADAMQLVSNPQIHTDGGNHGGMQQLPDRVRDLLTENPYHTSAGGPWVDKRGFTSLSTIVNRGEPALASGSDLDRGLLKQGSEIVKIEDRNPGFTSFHDNDSVADKMFGAASRDHRAVSDFITGDGMNATVTPGGRYNADDHVMSVLSHRWGSDEHGAEKLFTWIDDEATNPDPKVSANAGHTADTLAHMLVRNSDHLALNLPGHDGDSLGKVNPGVTQALAESMTPYLGNFAGAPDSMLINHTAQPFGKVDDLSKLFNVLDSDPTSAKIVNAAGSQWNDYLAYQAGLHPEQAPAMGTSSGHLTQAMTSGFQDQLKALDAHKQWEFTQQYNQKAAMADTVSNLAAALPEGKPVLSALITSGNSWFKVDGLSLPGDPTHPLPDDQQTEKLKKDVQDLIHPDTLRRQYCLASGYSQNHPEIISRFDTRPPGQQGVYPNQLLSWDAAANDPGRFFNTYASINDPQLGKFDNFYEDGLHDKFIGKHPVAPHPGGPR